VAYPNWASSAWNNLRVPLRHNNGGGVFIAIKKTIGLRAPPDEEAEGLDISEHSMESYPDFRVTSMI